MKLLHYKVHFWDELDENMNDDEGFVAGETAGDAVERIHEYYGAKNVENCMIEYLEGSDDGLVVMEDIKSLL